jgi:hypothetical protein
MSRSRLELHLADADYADQTLHRLEGLLIGNTQAAL